MPQRTCLQCGWRTFIDFDKCQSCHTSFAFDPSEAPKLDTARSIEPPELRNYIGRNPLVAAALVVVAVAGLTFLFRNIAPSSPTAAKVPGSASARTRWTPLPEKGEQNDEKKRRDFAFGMEVSSKESAATIRNIRYTVEGVSSKTLVLTADGVGPSDCLTLANSIYRNAAASVGFTHLTCRNRISDGEWSLVLSE